MSPPTQKLTTKGRAQRLPGPSAPLVLGALWPKGWDGVQPPGKSVSTLQAMVFQGQAALPRTPGHPWPLDHPLGTPAVGGAGAGPGMWQGSHRGVAQPRILTFSSLELRKGGHLVGERPGCAGTRQLCPSLTGSARARTLPSQAASAGHQQMLGTSHPPGRAGQRRRSEGPASPEPLGLPACPLCWLSPCLPLMGRAVLCPTGRKLPRSPLGPLSGCFTFWSLLRPEGALDSVSATLGVGVYV